MNENTANCLFIWKSMVLSKIVWEKKKELECIMYDLEPQNSWVG